MLNTSSTAGLSADKIHSLIKDYTYQTNYLTNFPFVLCLWDFKNETYAYVSDNVINVLGDPPCDFLQNGFAHSLKYFPESHRKIFIENILPTITHIIDIHIDSDQTKELRFSYSTKLKVHNNELRWFLHQLSIIETKEGMPAIGLKVVSDIHDIKKDNSIDLIVSIKNKNGNFESLFNETFHPGSDTLNLSTREKEILALIANGNSTKKIAERLNISENTVNNHRKNMLNKTDSASSHNLVKLAIQENLI